MYSRALHNAIIKAGDKDHPPMLVLENETFSTQATRERKEMYSIIGDDIKKRIDVKFEGAQIILTWIDNDIYFTVHTCPNAKEILSPTKNFDILKKHQNKVNEIRVERPAINANPLAFVATTQHPDYHPQAKPTYYTQTSSTRSYATTRSKGKEIAKAPSPPSELEHEVVSDEEETQKDKEIQRAMKLIFKTFKNIYKPIINNLRTSPYTKQEY
nr:hypothetical protein [Tanacetum cinerariifolium]